MFIRTTDTQLVSQLAFETPDILALRAAVAAASDADRPAVEAALDCAIKARREEVLDRVRDLIIANAERIEAAIFDPAVDAANEQLRYLIEFFAANFSITKHPKSHNDIPKGLMLTNEAKARGPVLAVGRTSLDLVPTRDQIKFAHDLDAVKAARAAQRGGR